MHSYTVHSSKAKLACQEVGSGPASVLLHAGVADKRSWTETMNLLQTGNRLVAYDRRGFGDTKYLPESFSHVDDLAAVIEHTGEDRVVLVGNSQGGRISIDYALANPRKVRGLVLVATAISGAPPIDESLLDPAVVALDHGSEEAYERGDLTEANRLEAHLWLDGPKEREGRVGGEARTLFLDMNGRALEAAEPGDEIEPPSAYERLAELTMPSLVIVGDLDMSPMMDRSRALVERAANARFEVRPGTAHLPQLEQPTQFASIVSEFLHAL